MSRVLGVAALVGGLIVSISQVVPMPANAAPVRKPSVAFVVECALSHESNDDPIVHPGHAAMSHLHSFFGNRSTTASSTAASLASMRNTTCDNNDDVAAYWAPSLEGANWVSMRAYYDVGSVDQASIGSFPFGLGIVAGNGRGSVAWSCGKSVGASGWSAAPNDCSGTRTVTVRITFAQCWDGKHRFLAESRHMVDAVNGGCPASHRVAVPRLRLILRSSSPLAPKAVSSGGLDTMHADFLNAWPQAPLATLVTRCIRGERSTSAELRSCRSKTSEPAPL